MVGQSHRIWFDDGDLPGSLSPPLRHHCHSRAAHGRIGCAIPSPKSHLTEPYRSFTKNIKHESITRSTAHNHRNPKSRKDLNPTQIPVHALRGVDLRIAKG